MAKIHVMLKPGYNEAGKAQVVEASGMTNINAKRLERYGILTGDVDESNVVSIMLKLAKFDIVESVEKDEVRSV